MSIYDFKVKDMFNEDVDMSEYKGKALLIVNTATGCGFTPQYDVSFRQFKKIDVNGKEEAPLYTYLKSQKGGLFKKIKWNFTKFLVDKEGNVVERFAPTTKPEDIEEIIKELL